MVFSGTIILFALNSILMSILNGQGEIRKYVSANITGSILSLFLSTFLIVKFKLVGALYALVISQSLVFFITLGLVATSSWFGLVQFAQGIDRNTLRKLSSYALMAVASSLALPISHYLIRNYLADNLGWESAGYWQAMWYISSIYLLVITSSLGVYYLPKLSSINEKKALKKEVLDGYKIILPIISVLALGVFLCKDLVIKIAFTEEFSAMAVLFKWQLIGDVIKIAGWVLSYVMVAKAMTKVFIYTEILFSISLVALSFLLVNSYGLVGTSYAFSLNYSMYFIAMAYLTRKRFV